MLRTDIAPEAVGEVLEEPAHQLIIMDKTGDTKVIWDSENKEEVKQARKTFNKLREKGFTAFSVKKAGDKDEVLTKFDKFAEKIILVPPMVRG